MPPRAATSIFKSYLEHSADGDEEIRNLLLKDIQMGFKLPDLQYLGYEIKEWWENWPARKWVNNNPNLIFGITGFSVLLLLVIIIWLLIPDKTVEQEVYKKEWYYDLKTEKLFTANIGQTPPIDAPSGPLSNGEPAGVRAYVFTYVDEPNEAEHFIGFLETSDPNFVPTGSKPIDNEIDAAQQWGQSKLIRQLKDERWYPANSRAGRYIRKLPFRPNENGERARYYRPD